jgi:hypothetical protein
MTSAALANPPHPPAVAGLGNRGGPSGQGSSAREVRGRHRGALHPGRGPAKAGRLLVDARGRTPHRPVSDRARRGQPARGQSATEARAVRLPERRRDRAIAGRCAR